MTTTLNLPASAGEAPRPYHWTVPNVTIVTGMNRDYLARHPSPAEVVLLAEVAISSVDYDLGGKALLYAQAGITDYWVIVPERQQIVVHRGPTPAGHTSVTVLGIEETVSPLVASDMMLIVRDLLGLSGDSGEE